MKLFKLFGVMLTTFLLIGNAYADHHDKEDKKGKYAKFAKYDKDGDKKLSKSEYLDMKGAQFDKTDVNNDGYLTRDEMKAARHKAKERYKKMREKHKADKASEVSEE